jgi:hypothetical protein
VANRINIGPKGSKLDWDNWGKPVTDAINEFDAAINTLWTTFLPTFSTQAGGGALNNGQRNGRYKVLGAVGLIKYEAHLIFGSTSTYGSGFFIIDLPFPASANSVEMSIGNAYFYSTGVLTREGGTRFNSTTQLIFDHPTLGVVTSAVPQTWKNTDELKVNILYEPA